jgi:uncharacterized DUF497 family protein
METRKVVWDSEKDIINRREHNIGFDVARLVFGDPHRIERIDQSEGNTSRENAGRPWPERFYSLFIRNGENPRLLSARLANKAERRSCHGYYHIDGKGWSEAD